MLVWHNQAMWENKRLGQKLPYLWLEITVDDTVLAQKLQRLQQLSTKARCRNKKQDNESARLPMELIQQTNA
jgi:hypothetical protein